MSATIMSPFPNSPPPRAERIQGTVRGAISAKGPDSSVGGVPVGFCSDDVHMEEEDQLRVQVKEERIGETHGKEPGEEQKVKELTTLRRTTWMTMWMT